VFATISKKISIHYVFPQTWAISIFLNGNYNLIYLKFCTNNASV
jgi:hypothetical protein